MTGMIEGNEQQSITFEEVCEAIHKKNSTAHEHTQNKTISDANKNIRDGKITRISVTSR